KWLTLLSAVSVRSKQYAQTFITFKAHFFRHTKKLDLLLSWNQVYNFPLQQLRLRVIAKERDDFSGKCDIEDDRILERLCIMRPGAWGNNLSVWDKDQTEY
ncbi:uncharacterized protein K444DRAFT_485540, partial [Hyaloscypha bicolor E]